MVKYTAFFGVMCNSSFLLFCWSVVKTRITIYHKFHIQKKIHFRATEFYSFIIFLLSINKQVMWASFFFNKISAMGIALHILEPSHCVYSGAWKQQSNVQTLLIIILITQLVSVVQKVNNAIYWKA